MKRAVLAGLAGLWLMTSPLALAADAPETVRFRVLGFSVTGQTPWPDREIQRILEPFLGDHDGLAGLEAATKALEAAFQAKGWAFHQVVVPPQKIEDGIVALQVVASSVDQVSVEGNHYFSEQNIRSSLPSLHSGAVINANDLARSLRLANDHPAKQVNATLRPGENPGSLDANIKVADSRPEKLFASAANTGDAQTGRTRLSLGAQHSNLFGRDHALTLSYTTSAEYSSDVSQWGAFYRIPLYGQAAGVSAFYSRSDVNQGRVANVFDVSGKGVFSGISADYSFYPIGFYTHKIVADVQDHRFENDVDFSGLQIGTNVRSRPLGLTYQGRYERAWGNAGFSAQVLKNLSGGNDNNDVAYDGVRQGADQSWNAYRYGADTEVKLPARWALRARLTGQRAGEPLISGEEFGLGGSRSVRGFDERVVSGENGQQVSTELLLPPFIHPSLGLLTFVDVGWIQREDPVALGSFDAEHLSSCGIGLRWQGKDWWKNDVALQVDAAYILNDAHAVDSGDGKIHFYLFYRL